MTALETVRSFYGQLSEADQLSILVDLIQGGGAANALQASDRFVDALIPLDEALCDAWPLLTQEAEPKPLDDRFWRDSAHALNAGMGDAQ